MARQLIKPGDTDRLINNKVLANLADLSLLPAHHDRRPDFVRSPRAAATILDALLGAIAGPRFTGAARNFRSFARQANARFAAAYAALGPTAITLLTSNTFEIGGARKALADCYTERFLPGDSATIALVADEGLSVDFTGGGTGTSASATLTATADLNAALNPEIGVTAVIDITPVSPDPNVGMVILIGFGVGDDQISALFHPVGGGVFGIAINHFHDGAPHYTPVLTPAPFGQRYRLAFSVSPHFAALSVNGGDAISIDPSINLTGLGLVLEAFIFSGVAGASARIGDVRYYPLKTDLAALKQLSTQ